MIEPAWAIVSFMQTLARMLQWLLASDIYVCVYIDIAGSKDPGNWLCEQAGAFQWPFNSG